MCGGGLTCCPNDSDVCIGDVCRLPGPDSVCGNTCCQEDLQQQVPSFVTYHCANAEKSLCCPEGQVEVGDSGVCCLPGQIELDGLCCAPGRVDCGDGSCCQGTCQDGTCQWDITDAECVPKGFTEACAQHFPSPECAECVEGCCLPNIP